MATATKKLSARQVLNFWFDPKNGKIGEKYTARDGSTKETKSFHAVTSGFNDFIQVYYGISGKEFLEDAEAKRLCTLRPVGRGKSGKGIPGVRVYPFNTTMSNNKAEVILKEMGLS